MNKWIFNSLAAAAAAVVCSVSLADELALKVGDPAPKYDLKTWAKGPAIPRLERGHIYLLDFWATRCAPCIEALPHLKELSQQYKGKVTVVSIGVPYDWEKVDDVKKFVRKKDSLMTYPVAVDAAKDQGEKFYDRWAPPAGFRGLPAMFIVNGEGKIAWAGTPNGVDEPLKQVVAGNYDLAAARKQQQAEHDAAMSETQQREAFQGMMSRKEWDKIIKKVDDLVARNPDQESKLFAFKLEALAATHVDQALEYAQALPEESRGTAAELLADKPNLPKPAYQFIARELEKEVAKDPNAHPMTWQTLASVQHQLGNLNRAIEAQKTALAKSDAMGYKEISEQMRATLDTYVAEKKKAH